MMPCVSGGRHLYTKSSFRGPFSKNKGRGGSSGEESKTATRRVEARRDDKSKAVPHQQQSLTNSTLCFFGRWDVGNLVGQLLYSECALLNLLARLSARLSAALAYRKQ